MKFFIYFLLLISSLNSFSQEQKKDTTNYKDTYGIRVGIDVFNPIYTLFNTKRKSIELVGDYRLSKKYYIATEIGFMNNTINESYYDLETKGQYIKVGANYNLYKNWLEMDNEVYVGLRYGFSTFSQDISNITINSDVILPENQLTETINYNGLNASWGELVMGLKAAIYKNVYLGFSVSMKRMIANKKPDNFKNIYVPGFNRVYLNDGGFGFNYTISYRFPLYKKNKIKTKDEKIIE